MKVSTMDIIDSQDTLCPIFAAFYVLAVGTFITQTVLSYAV